MSLDLSLIIDNPGRRFPGASSLCGVDRLTVLHGDGLIMAMRDALHEALAKGSAITPPPVDVYGDDGARTTTTDAWGQRLWALPAGLLAAVTPPDPLAFPDLHQWNLALLALLGTLAPDTPVVLYWS